MGDSDSVCEKLGDELRIRKLFEACDTNGDGYIDSQDLQEVCKELRLEDSLEELMKQLGADADGRISYRQFLQKRLDLGLEIDSLKCTSTPALAPDTASENSQGKLDRWEWDSGARDLSPVPAQVCRAGPAAQTLAQKSLAEQQAQQYEQQITELHSVIAELTRKLHQQKVSAIAEEDELSEVGTSAADDCVSNIQETSDTSSETSLSNEVHGIQRLVPPAPVKMAERVRLRRAVEQPAVCASDTCDCAILSARLENVRAQAALLAVTLEESRAHADRMALLCGKYESNAIALHTALLVTDTAIQAYDVLLALGETAGSEGEDRAAAIFAARRLLQHLEPNTDTSGPWKSTHENLLRKHISLLKSERAMSRNTHVQLESPHAAPAALGASGAGAPARVDLETAVLLQEVMALRQHNLHLQRRLLQVQQTHSSATRPTPNSL